MSEIESVMSRAVIDRIRFWLDTRFFRKHWQVNKEFARYCAAQRAVGRARERVVQRPL